MAYEYDEVEYWNSRPEPNTPGREQSTEDIDYVRQWIKKGDRVFDFGPGIGRTFCAYARAKIVVGYDVSRVYIQRVLQQASAYDFKFRLFVGQSAVIPSNVRMALDDEFDVAVACNVLIHQKPENIVPIMKNLGEFATKVVVVTWSTDPKIFQSDLHCFNHNYKQICDHAEYRIVDWNKINETLFFVYAR